MVELGERTPAAIRRSPIFCHGNPTEGDAPHPLEKLKSALIIVMLVVLPGRLQSLGAAPRLHLKSGLVFNYLDNWVQPLGFKPYLEW